MNELEQAKEKIKDLESRKLDLLSFLGIPEKYSDEDIEGLEETDAKTLEMMEDVCKVHFDLINALEKSNNPTDENRDSLKRMYYIYQKLRTAQEKIGENEMWDDFMIALNKEIIATMDKVISVCRNYK